MELAEIMDLDRYPIRSSDFQATVRQTFDETGVYIMAQFLRPAALEAVRQEGMSRLDDVFAQRAEHTVYLSPPDPDLPPNHPRNRMVTSSKGCLTDDQISQTSPLRALYDDADFRRFLCVVMGEGALHGYADPLSSINLHFAETGQELGWHFDNSSFAITLMVQPPEKGGRFEYVPAVRDADAGEMGYDAVRAVLDGEACVQEIDAQAGTLVFFRGRNAIHRVAPNEGDRTRILAVLAYNAEPGVALSETARMTFYGRIG